MEQKLHEFNHGSIRLPACVCSNVRARCYLKHPRISTRGFDRRSVRPSVDKASLKIGKNRSSKCRKEREGRNVEEGAARRKERGEGRSNEDSRRKERQEERSEERKK